MQHMLGLAAVQHKLLASKAVTLFLSPSLHTPCLSLSLFVLKTLFASQEYVEDVEDAPLSACCGKGPQPASSWWRGEVTMTPCGHHLQFRSECLICWCCNCQPQTGIVQGERDVQHSLETSTHNLQSHRVRNLKSFSSFFEVLKLMNPSSFLKCVCELICDTVSSAAARCSLLTLAISDSDTRVSSCSASAELSHVSGTPNLQVQELSWHPTGVAAGGEKGSKGKASSRKRFLHMQANIFSSSFYTQ